LQKLTKALEDCCRSRHVEEIVLTTRGKLDVLGDGLEQLGMYTGELTDEAIRATADAADARDHQLAQLRNLGETAEVQADADRLEQELRSDRPWRGAVGLRGPAARVRARYVEVRRGILAAQAAQAEVGRSRIKIRPGFERLSGDEAHRVLRPFTEALPDTGDEALQPTLVELRDRFGQRLGTAADEADDLLDEIVSRPPPVEPGKTATDGPRPKPKPVVKVDVRLQGREIATKEQLETVLVEIRERVTVQLEKGARVRLV